MGRLLEKIGEVGQRPRRSHPGELVGHQPDVGLEHVAEMVADAAVDPIGGDDDIAVEKPRLEAAWRNGLAEIEHDAELAAPRIEHLEQRQAGAAGKAIAALAHLAGPPVLGANDADVIPIGEAVADHRVGFGIAAEKGAERVVGKEDAETEGVVLAVLLMDVDLPSRPRLYGEDDKLEPAGTGADDIDFYAAVPVLSSQKNACRPVCARPRISA